MSEEGGDRIDYEEMTPGERLELLLDERRMTQTALAEECGRTPQYVNNIVRRGQRITQEFAQELLAATGVNLNWLFTGKGPMLWGEAGGEISASAEEIPADFDTSGVVAQMQHASEHLLEAAEALERSRRDGKGSA